MRLFGRHQLLKLPIAADVGTESNNADGNFGILYCSQGRLSFAE